ncbi:hypothetical protein HN011_002762 [Eciton burchellii]|nr:hypothetical protein HN011_002762 [Eciton burchellii]
MAHMIRSKFVLLSLKHAKRIAPRIPVPLKHQRLCFHTSGILDVKGKELLMPSLSPTMENGTIVKWLKKEGDKLEPGDAIADIQTDKAIVTLEFDDEGILAKIIIPEGAKDIKIGTLIGLTVEADEDWKEIELPDTTKSLEAPEPEASASEQPSSASVTMEIPPGQQNILMPALSPTMTTGTIVKWLKKEGEEIQPGDVLADIQTDKAIMNFELEDEAVLAKILVPENSQVKIGQLIAITVEKGMDWKQVVVPISTTSATAVTTAPTTSSSTQPISAKSSAQVYGLAVKRLLEEYNLNPDSIKGTGRVNRLLKGDVLSYIETHNIERSAPKFEPPPIVNKIDKVDKVDKIDKIDKIHSPSTSDMSVSSDQASSYRDIKISNIRAIIAKRLGESKSTIPHSYAGINIVIDKLLKLRKELKAEDINISVNDFITKGVAHALVACPDVNTLYQKGQIVRIPEVDISIAVATPSGLITPIVFNSVTKSLIDISKNIRELADKAKKGQLKPHEFQGGTFTISNLGMYGIKEFSAIINPPQTAILAVGAGREELDSSLAKITEMTVTLSYDRRAIDESQAAEFLAVLKSILENPALLVAGKMQALRYERDAY